MAKADRDVGLDRDKVTDNTKLSAMSASFAESKHLELDIYPAERAMLYKLQKMNDEIKELHRFLGSEVTSNVSTNLSVTAAGAGLKINSSDGTNADIPAATTTAWGAMSDDYVHSLATASLAPPAEGTYHNGGNEHLVWIPSTRFYGERAVYDEGKVTVSSTSAFLYYDFAGIDRKKVTHVAVYTSTALNGGLVVQRYRGTHGSALATLASKANTNAVIDITDWTCAMGEQLNIRVYPRSTTVELYGAILTLANA